MNNFEDIRETDTMDEDADEIDEVGGYLPVGGTTVQTGGKNPYNNPKNHLITAALLLGMMILLLFADSFKNGMEQKTAAEKEVISIAARTDGSLWTAGGAMKYYTLADGRLYDIEPFEADAVQRFIVRRDGSVFADNDMDGYPDGKADENMPQTEPIAKLIEQIAAAEQTMDARILYTQGECFVYVGLDASLWKPYELYYYDAEKDGLYYLTTLNDMDVAGIRLGEDFAEKIDDLTE